MRSIKREWRSLVAPVSLVAAIAAFSGLFSSPSHAVGGDCERLRRAIADASRTGSNSQYEAAAERQRGEIDRTVSYARQLGCENKKFLFFGSDPPAQCAQINGQIGRMRANLEDLQAKAGGGPGGRGELVARYNAQCGNSPRPSGIIDALFGQPKPGDLQEQPLTPDGVEPEKPEEKSAGPVGEARAGGKAVCVRSCDGAFFPLSYSASSGGLDTLAEMCRAQCPNAEVTLYTYPVSGEIEQAVSINGARYMDSPTALRYRRTFDPSCSCRRRGETWANALVRAESLLGKEDKTDIIVTPEKSAELSRPKADPKVDAKAKATKSTKASAGALDSASGSSSSAGSSDSGKIDVNGVDTVLKDAAAAISREGSGIAGGADSTKAGPVDENQGKVFDEMGSDGSRRKVRIIGE